MDEMASAYLPQILRVQPEGPYFLLGYSMGGVIAYEVAQRLSRAGHDVGWVGLIDTRSTWTADALSDEQVLSWLVRHGLGLDVEVGPLLSLDPAHRVERLLDVALETGKLPSDYDRSRLRRMIDIYDINVSALSGYQLQPYEADVTLFRASDCTDPREDLGWRRLARRLAICRVPGDHFSMILPGNVEVMARYAGAVLPGKS
jgi:thioesterase domain-containing protein